MPIPVSIDHQPVHAPAIVRSFTRDDVVWNRPIFKAPPLNVVPPIADISELVAAIRKPDALVN